MGDRNNQNTCFDKTFPFNIGDDVYVMDIEYSPPVGIPFGDYPRAYITETKIEGFAYMRLSDTPPTYKVIVQNYARFGGPTRYVDEKFLFKSREEAIWNLSHNPSNYGLSVNDAKSMALDLLASCNHIL